MFFTKGVDGSITHQCTNCAHKKVCRFRDAYDRIYNSTKKHIEDIEDKTMGNADGQFSMFITCRDHECPIQKERVDLSYHNECRFRDMADEIAKGEPLCEN